MDIKQEDGSWTSFVADRIPEELDDTIKGHHAAFYLAQMDLTPEELLDVLPVAFLMTRTLPEPPGIAKYPVDAREKEGAPTMTVRSCCKLATKVASQDLANLDKVFDIAKSIHDKTPDTGSTGSA